MKIGIISINMHTTTLNLGCIIHSFAFQQFLQAHGYESEIIEYKPVYYGKGDVRHPLLTLQENGESDPEKLEKWRALYSEREIRYDKFWDFIDRNYQKTKKCYTAQLLDEEDPGFDCYICVSDVIWKAFSIGLDRGFLLDCECMRGKKKLAYAASMGVRRYNEGQEQDFIRAIGDFDHISVREKNLSNYIHRLTDLEIPVVLDPVFLMPPVFYEELAREPQVRYEHYVLIYMVESMDDAFVQGVIAFADEKGLPVIELSEEVGHRQRFTAANGYSFVYAIGVEEWLWYIRHAAYIFTNSFHGTCFSIIFGRQVFCGARGGDKISYLLETFGLTDRWLKTEEFLAAALACEEIDHDAVMPKLVRERERCTQQILEELTDVQSRPHRGLLPDKGKYVDRSADVWEAKRRAALEKQRKKNALPARIRRRLGRIVHGIRKG